MSYATNELKCVKTGSCTIEPDYGKSFKCTFARRET